MYPMTLFVFIFKKHVKKKKLWTVFWGLVLLSVYFVTSSDLKTFSMKFGIEISLK